MWYDGSKLPFLWRDVAQLGSALRSGRRGRWFESSHPDLLLLSLVKDNQLRLSKLIDYTREQVRTLYRSTIEIQQRWAVPEERAEIIDLLADRGIDFDELKAVTNLSEADPFDLLCYIAFDAPVLTCKQRAEKLRRGKSDFFEQYGEEARAILEILLDKYAEKGVEEFNVPTTFKANREFANYGNVIEIAERFGGVQELRDAVNQLQSLLYSA